MMTLTPKEQTIVALARSSTVLLAEHMTLDQAATLNSRVDCPKRHHPCVSLRLTRRKALPPLLLKERRLARWGRKPACRNWPSPSVIRPPPLWFTLPSQPSGTQGPDPVFTHLSELALERPRQASTFGRTTLRRILEKYRTGLSSLLRAHDASLMPKHRVQPASECPGREC